MGVERRRNSVSERLPLRGRLLTASLTNGPDPPSVTRNIAVRGPERAGAYARVIGGSGRRGVGGVQGVAVLEAKSFFFDYAHRTIPGDVSLQLSASTVRIGPLVYHIRLFFKNTYTIFKPK
jgi:hypothetical protein